MPLPQPAPIPRRALDTPLLVRVQTDRTTTTSISSPPSYNARIAEGGRVTARMLGLGSAALARVSGRICPRQNFLIEQFTEATSMYIYDMHGSTTPMDGDQLQVCDQRLR